MHIHTITHRRKTRARRTRQSRKATQPVPLDVLEKINKHDQEEIARTHSSEPKSNLTKDISQSSGEEITSSESSADSTPAQARKPGIKDNLLKKLSMSAFKPSPRPAPKSKRSPSQPVLPWNTQNNGIESPPQQEKQEQQQVNAQGEHSSTCAFTVSL